MNSKANEVCKTANNGFEKYVTFKLEYSFQLFLS
jgi:hypothetical protein